jgi:hypothetical protein
VNVATLQSLAAVGKVSFFNHSSEHQHRCSWQADGVLIVEDGQTFAEALENVYAKALKSRWGGSLQPRVITRVMDDTIKTRDGLS